MPAWSGAVRSVLQLPTLEVQYHPHRRFVDQTSVTSEYMIMMAVLSILLSAGLFGLGQCLPAVVGCDRTSLLAAADAYVAAQTRGKIGSSLESLFASNFTYYENNKASTPQSGVLRSAIPIDHRRTTVDTKLCRTYTELISAASPGYVIGTQITQESADTSLPITTIDTIVSTTGSWLFDAGKTLQYALKEDWSPLPENKRVSRALLQQTADAYLDMWSNATASEAVAWGTPCTRLEGSAYTGQGKDTDSCKPGIPSNHSQAPNTHRRYVIDEAMGSCSVLCVWEHMMMAADSHEFRLEGGKLRYVHTMTVCPGQVCRL